MSNVPVNGSVWRKSAAQELKDSPSLCIGLSKGVPVYPGGDALSLLSEIADAADELLQRPTRLPCDGVILSAEDVKAIRWAIAELRVRDAS